MDTYLIVELGPEGMTILLQALITDDYDKVMRVWARAYAHQKGRTIQLRFYDGVSFDVLESVG